MPRYVSKAGADNTADSTDIATPCLTINAACQSGSSGETVEIIDEGTYSESSISIKQGMTITHTASALGRPIIDGGGAPSSVIFDATFSPNTDITLTGLEMRNAEAIFGAGGNSLSNLTISGCFAHDIRRVSNQNIAGISPSNTVVFDQSSFFFDTSTTTEHIRNNGYMEIKNCFMSASGLGGFGVPIVRSFTRNITASFSTFVFRDGSHAHPILRGLGIARNCIVTSSNAPNADGIGAEDHDYNLVDVASVAYMNASDVSESAGSNDLEVAPTFIGGTSVGQSYSIVANFALAEGSRGIDEGVTFDSIAVDITGTIRPQNSLFDIGAFEFITQDPEWDTDGDGSQTYQTKFGSSFEIHGTANKLTTRTFAFGTENRQAPYFITIPGPPSLRERKTPYKAET